ncbi:unnamed protein product [Musa textilis]
MRSGCRLGRGHLPCLRVTPSLHTGAAPVGTAPWVSLQEGAASLGSLAPRDDRPCGWLQVLPAWVRVAAVALAGATRPLQAGRLCRQPTGAACLATNVSHRQPLRA